MTAPLPRIAIACIETQAHAKAARAILSTLKASANLPICAVYWFSNQAFPNPERVESEWGADFIQWISIKPFNASLSFNDQLSELTLDLLPKSMDADFYLLVQADGYAANANAWTDAFYEYDYIGATWALEPEGRNVGNGGFSWRSKKLYDALLDIRANDPMGNLLKETPTDETWFDKFVGRSFPEDNLICKVYRPLLEKQYGIRFAPAEIADQFSIETNTTSSWLGKSFGFHGHLVGSFYVNK